MSQPYVGEIRMVGFNFAPDGWEFCEGQLLSIAEYSTLYNLIGTTYGGNGQTTFALPDLRGRVPIHQGSGYVIGEQGGSETVTLSLENLPSHSHSVYTAATATSVSPVKNYPAIATNDAYSPPVDANGLFTTTLASNSIGPNGGGEPHENRQAFLVMNYVISLFGVYPSEN
jgi:microcystin-dependent protein